MKKNEIARQLLRKSLFLAFSREDLEKIDTRYSSKRYVFVRFGYQWDDPDGNSRKSLSLALKKRLQFLFDKIKDDFPNSDHELNYASLRAQAGTAVPHRIVLDIASADLLFFDATYPNPNVFFELGIAYAMNKNLFLLLRRDGIEKLPSDLSGLTYCAYEREDNPVLDSFFEGDIQRAMKTVLARKAKLNADAS